jgi:hypothetical protein
MNWQEMTSSVVQIKEFVCQLIFRCVPISSGVCSNTVGWGTVLQAGRTWVRFPMVSFEFFHWPNPSSRTMPLGLTQPLTETCTTDLLGGKGDRCPGLTTLSPSCANCQKFWEPQPPGPPQGLPWSVKDRFYLQVFHLCMNYSYTINETNSTAWCKVPLKIQ